MSQDGRAGNPDPSSSFPMSSPGFWAEAAKVPIPPVKRLRTNSPLLEVKDEEKAVPASPEERSDTALKYLPNRLDPFDQDNPHAYLANPEYAPNRFGDIGDYMRKKEIKVQTQNRDIALASALEGTPQIFKDLSFYINGNTQPPMEELRKMILQRGGEVRPVLRNKGMVKFIIAPMLTQMKFKQFANYRVVKEGWITESCKQGKLLEWSKWKLQVQGGWEESSRKGMAGFLAGTQTQAPRDEPESEDEEDAAMKEEVTKAKARAVQATPSAPAIAIASSSSLLRPMSRPAPSIPISPGATKAATPQKEHVPSYVQRPEGGFYDVSYYSKDSNDDAARLLKDQEWRLKNTAERGNEGGFIDGYYQNSRLHHLSTWKAELKVLVAAAQRDSEAQSLSKPANTTLSPYTLAGATLPRAAQSTASAGEKVIMHVDFDCFFVSCGLATRPHLKGKPTVVCHSQAGRMASSTSEIASASYEARAKGVKNGISLGRARALVGSELQTIPYEFDTYKKFSLAFYTVLMGYADELQAVSVDEALIDVTSAVAARAVAPEEAVDGGDEGTGVRDPALEIAEKIRDEVRGLTEGCEVSIGIAHNVLLAKLATRRAKPAGVYHLKPTEIPDFIAPLDVEDFPSIGYSIKGKIEDKFGTTKCGDLLEQSKGALRALLGPKTGDMVWGYLRGIDDRKLEPHKERKSISAEMNYGIRFQNQDQAETCMVDLAAEVSKRMKQVDAKGRLLTLKLMSRHPDAPLEPPKFLGHGWCETFNKSSPIGNKGGTATDAPEILGAEAVKLLRAMKLDPRELRGVGIQITKLDSDKAEKEREAGQATLSFGIKRKREVETPVVEETGDADATGVKVDDGIEGIAEEAGSRRATTSPTPALGPAAPPAAVQPALSPLVTRHQAIAGPSRIPTSSDGIDPDFLAALPADLRQEVKQQHATTRASKRVEVPEAAPTAPVEINDKPIPSPRKGQNSAAHITKQLRPKVKTQLRAAAVAELPLYGAWAKAQGKEEVVDLTEEEDVMVCGYRSSELKELGIDLDVLAELPDEMRSEIVDEERRKHGRRKVLHKPADTSRLRSRETSGRPISLSPTRSSRAGSVPVQPAQPLMAITRPTKPALLKAVDLPDVLGTVTKWMDSRGQTGPAAKDAGKVKAYLLKCMDAGLGGLENAVEVLKYMHLEIRIRWGPDLEVMNEEEEELWRSGSVDPILREVSVAGREWWETWRGFKAAVDEVAIRDIGAVLAI